MKLDTSAGTTAALMLVLLAVGCGGGSGSGGNAGVPNDAGSVSDAGTTPVDSAIGDAGGPGPDAGIIDGGATGDAGGPGPDAGIIDSGATGDAGGPGPDAGIIDGGGTPTGWQHVFDMTGKSSVNDVVELLSGDVVAVGAVSSFGSGVEDGFVARVSSAGAYVWSRAIGTAQVDGLNAVVGDGAGGVVVVGHSEYSSASVPFVARFDASGALVFSENLIAPTAGFFWDSNLTLTDVVRMNDGNFALVGHHEDDDKAVAGPGHFRGWIGIMTPTGQLVLQRRFGSFTAYLGFYEGAVLPGGDLVVVGWWNQMGLVMRLDATLGVKWRATQGSDFNDYGVDLVSVLPLASGDLILGGRYFEADFSNTISHWFLQRLSGAGVGVWSRRLEHDYSGVSGLYARGPNEFVALGYAPNGSDADAYAAILDTNGFVLAQRSLGLTGTDWLTEGVVSSDGSLIAAGYDENTPYGSARIAKIPSSVPSCDPTAGDRLASVTYPPAGSPDTSDFGDAYTVTVSSSGPTKANGPASSIPIVVCAP